MNTKALRQKILDLAIHGKLVPQDPNDEPASVLLERIRDEKERLIKEGKIKRPKKIKTTSDKPHYPYELPEGWAWTTVGEICSKIGSGSTPKGSNYSKTGIPFFRSQNVYNTSIVLSDIKYISDEVHQSMIGTEVVANDLLLNITGGSLGRCAIVPDNFSKGNVSQHVCILRSILIRPKYLHTFILSSFFAKSMKITGSGREGLPKYNLEKMFLPLPPLNEQDKIIGEVDKFFEFVDTLESGEDNLIKQIAKTRSKILDLAIHGKLVPQDPTDEPASELLKRINPKAEITCDNGHYQKLPEGWTVCCLENVAKVLDYLRKPINSNERNSRIANKHENELFPYYGATGQVGFIDDYLVDGTFLLLGEDGAPFLDKYAIKSYPIKGKCWVNNHAHILEPLCDFDYLMYYLNHVDYKDYVNGSTRLKLTQSDMRSIIILLPPLTEQKRISVKVKYLFRLLDSIACHL
jgi:type I restriction enzyme S subunit